MRLDTLDPKTKRTSQALGRWCRFILNGVDLDSEVIFVADEEMGLVQFGEYTRAHCGPFSSMRWHLDGGGHPILHTLTGEVEILLMDEAPESVRRLYEQIRRGAPRP